MVDGVHGAAIINAVDLVVEVLNTDTDRATLHLPNMVELPVHSYLQMTKPIQPLVMISSQRERRKNMLIT